MKNNGFGFNLCLRTALPCTSILVYACCILLVHLKNDVICAGKANREKEEKSILAGEVDDKKDHIQSTNGILALMEQHH